MSDKKEYYIDPKEFFDELVKCLKADNISEKLGQMFYLISEKYSNHQNFVRYSHIKDDLIGVGALACCRGFSKFEPLKDRSWSGEDVTYHYTTCNHPFAFFTKCIHNGFIAYLKAEYKQRNINNEMKLTLGLEADEGYMDMMREKEALEKQNEKNENDDSSSSEANTEQPDKNGIVW